MTLLDPRPPASADSSPSDSGAASLSSLSAPLSDPGLDPSASSSSPEAESTGLAPAALGFAVASATLSSLGAAWMIGGMFRGFEARLVGLLGVIIGCGFVFLAARLRSGVLQYLPLPTALIVGAVLMSSSSGGGTSSLPSLVKDAATSSQVLQPPIDFAPGWRMILLVVLALLSSAAASMALSTGRTRLAVAIPTPLTVAAAFVQPGSSAITTSAVSVAFVMLALATSYAADGVGESFDRRFEMRRLGRSALAGVILVGVLIAASQISFLFPQEDTHRVVPPRRPPVSPPQPDVPLYTVKGTLNGPLRVGVIDVYDNAEQAWLLPPVDNDRLVRLNLPTDLPDAPAAFGVPSTVSVTIQQARGHLMPTTAGARSVTGSAVTDYDPRTQSLALAQRPLFTGLHYDVTSNPAPNGAQLSAVTGKVPGALKEFLTAPDVPPYVQTLLAKAPVAPYARLQTLRTALYKKFTASGQGKPTDVSADRVVQLLNGGTGNPYELTASEALLARWAGVPARIGFGYFNGTTLDNGEMEFRPSNAATYLEAYFAPYGWVPIVGTPPRAQQTLSNNQRNNDSSIEASKELGINVFLPVKVTNHLPLYVYARYILVRVLPVLAGLGLLLLLYPVWLKRVRARRRAQWAASHGPAGRIAVAYCAVRDQMIDLALPGRTRTPLELVELVEEDEEHAELAWLATRGLWGDLRAELTEQDAMNAERLAGSVSDRLAKAQPETARLLAAVSRASLRQPYSAELPNVWFSLSLRGRLPRLRLRSFVGRLVARVRRMRPNAATSVLLVILSVFTLGGCSGGSKSAADPNVPFPSRLAPASVAGLEVKEESKAASVYVTGAKDQDVIVSDGKVLSFNRGGLVQAALQVAQLKPGYTSNDNEVVKAIANSVGKTTKLRPQAQHELYSLLDGTQRIYLWFPTVKSMALLVVRAEITEGAAEALARGLIDYGDGGTINEKALAAAFVATPTTSPSPAASGSPAPAVSGSPAPAPSGSASASAYASPSASAGASR